MRGAKAKKLIPLWVFLGFLAAGGILYWYFFHAPLKVEREMSSPVVISEEEARDFDEKIEDLKEELERMEEGEIAALSITPSEASSKLSQAVGEFEELPEDVEIGEVRINFKETEEGEVEVLGVARIAYKHKVLSAKIGFRVLVEPGEGALACTIEDVEIGNLPKSVQEKIKAFLPVGESKIIELEGLPAKILDLRVENGNLVLEVMRD